MARGGLGGNARGSNGFLFEAVERALAIFLEYSLIVHRKKVVSAMCYEFQKKFCDVIVPRYDVI